MSVEPMPAAQLPSSDSLAFGSRAVTVPSAADRQSIGGM